MLGRAEGRKAGAAVSGRDHARDPAMQSVAVDFFPAFERLREAAAGSAAHGGLSSAYRAVAARRYPVERRSPLLSEHAALARCPHTATHETRAAAGRGD